jgi:hypothetical protein
MPYIGTCEMCKRNNITVYSDWGQCDDCYKLEESIFNVLKWENAGHITFTQVFRYLLTHEHEANVDETHTDNDTCVRLK